MHPSHPLPSERDLLTQLPSMTAAAVCKRMLRNLCSLQCTGNNPYLRREDSRQLPSKLLPCLLQLTPEELFSEALAALTWQITVEADNGGPVELYLKQCQRRLVRVVGQRSRFERYAAAQHTLVAGGWGATCIYWFTKAAMS